MFPSSRAADPAADAALIGGVAPPALHVMTLNIRRRMVPDLRPDDRWERRAPRVSALLRMERPAVLGLQEALPSQAAFVHDALGDAYRFIGRGRRANGAGEGCPLFYDSTRLDLLSWQQTALSDHPHRAGSVSWGNMVPRIAVSATFRDRATSARLFVVNTHFDAFSQRSRVRSAEAMRTLVSEQQDPAVVMGDLNTGAGTAPIRELLAGGVLTDTWERAQTRASPEWGTFANYHEPRLGRKRIDWIVVSPRVTVSLAAINGRRYEGGWASDHLPVQAVLQAPAGEGA
ncbi:endonuclease/exonuclease/phosphatase family protein [Microbacterium sp. LRZ72]|nr:endonuclease/exonuclease/phosphatase family protein [Microbacterium sp. LRZ72]MDX2376103.1 endonuclease/exonuclease/phosphatase family protein [Microbacterium sp. LRZ72]